VSSWREIASAEAQAELDALLDTMLGFAQQQLALHGEFFPYAAAIAEDGRLELVEASVEAPDDQPPSAEVREACFEALRARRDEIRAGAVASDVRVSEPAAGDAIQVELEHAEGHALAVLFPYSKPPGDVPLEYGPLSAHAGEPRIWS
jgi:hypothetical protein